MRVFAALPLPTTVAAGLAAAIEPLRRAYPRLRWVSPAGYHLTLHFFGEIEERAVRSLKTVMADPRLRVPPMTARFGGVGQFPERGTPRVLHAFLEKGAGEAAAFHDLLAGLLAPLGYLPDSRGFSPHVTLARASGQGPEPGWETGVDVPRRDFLISECVLFQSVLGAGGARYAPLAAAQFGAGEQPR